MEDVEGVCDFTLVFGSYCIKRETMGKGGQIIGKRRKMLSSTYNSFIHHEKENNGSPVLKIEFLEGNS